MAGTSSCPARSLPGTAMAWRPGALLTPNRMTGTCDHG